MEEKLRHMWRSSGNVCWAFNSAQEAVLEPGVFNLWQASTLASEGGRRPWRDWVDRLFTATWAMAAGCL